MDTITVTHKGVELEVEFDYQPYEEQVRYYSDGSGYPGCAEQAEIHEVLFKGESIYEIYDNLNGLDDLEDCVIETIHKNR